MTPAERALLIALAKFVLRYVGAYGSTLQLEEKLKVVEKESS